MDTNKPASFDLENDNLKINNLSFVHFNIRSILASGSVGPRLIQLSNRCFYENYDVVSLTETHLSSGINDNEIKIENYEIYRKDRDRNGGGIPCYVKKVYLQNLLKA